jgi:predicted HTH domain antitoxin
VDKLNTVKVELEFPVHTLTAAHLKGKNLKSELKKIIALHLFETGVLSLGKACELAGITRWEFFELNKTAQIPLHYGAEDFENDMKTLQEIMP